jgi:histidinol-phosphate aminotransferase
MVLGNGSDELIQLVTLAVARPGAKVVVPEPTFVMYRMIATFCGLECIGVPLAADFELDIDALEAAIDSHDPALIWLAWPNNPTGNLWPARHIERVLERARGLVVVDEAYAPFAQASWVPALGRWPHLAVLRTVSKLGLAGLRLGALLGSHDWLEPVDKLRLPYNINRLTQASVAFALDHADRLDAQAATLRMERERLRERLSALDGVTAYPSAANFVLLHLAEGHARAVFDGLRSEGVLVKCLDGSHPHLADCLRVTVGTPEQNDTLVTAFARVLG